MLELGFFAGAFILVITVSWCIEPLIDSTRSSVEKLRKSVLIAAFGSFVIYLVINAILNLLSTRVTSRQDFLFAPAYLLAGCAAYPFRKWFRKRYQKWVKRKRGVWTLNIKEWNSRQIVLLLTSVGIIGIMLLFPPFVYDSGDYDIYEFAGYHFIARELPLLKMTTSWSQSETVIGYPCVYSQLLMLQCLFVVAIGGIVVYDLR